MKIGFSLDDVFEIAEEIERNGKEFYRGVADMDAMKPQRDLLLGLAEKEDAHERIFAAIRRQNVHPAPELGTDDVLVGYIRALAGRYVFPKAENLGQTLKGVETVEDVLRVAMQREKDSIVLYSGMMDALAEGEERETVGLILREEKLHLLEIAKALQQARAAAGG